MVPTLLKENMKISKLAKVCYCGKCNVACNKYGKRAKCDACGQRRVLGQLVIISEDLVLFMCDECLAEHQQKTNEEQNERVNQCLRNA